MHLVVLQNIGDTLPDQGKCSLSDSDDSELHHVRELGSDGESPFAETVLGQEQEIYRLYTPLSYELI